MPNKIPYCNKSRHGWWIASYLERFEYDDEEKTDLNRRCLAWENTILVRAPNREVAYRKAMTVGRQGNGSLAWDAVSGRKGHWRYEGLTSLPPIYEKIEDGSEIIWREYRNRSVRKIQSRVKGKNDLEAFDDSHL